MTYTFPIPPPPSPTLPIARGLARTCPTASNSAMILHPLHTQGAPACAHAQMQSDQSTAPLPRAVAPDPPRRSPGILPLCRPGQRASEVMVPVPAPEAGEGADAALPGAA
jgi:hypothetical protein